MENTQTKFETQKLMLSPEELAERWGITKYALEYWRRTGDGPTYRKLGQKPNSPVRYMLADVLAFEEAMPKIDPLAQTVEASYVRVAASR